MRSQILLMKVEKRLEKKPDWRRPPGATNILSWNCRGLGRPRAVRAAVDLVRSYKPQVLELIETKLKSEMQRLRIKLGYRNCFVVDMIGLSGGLALLWNGDTDLTVKSYSRFHIDTLVQGEKTFRATLFYGNPRAHLREKSWNLLRKIRSLGEGSWVVIGDFNEVIHTEEMCGKRLRDKAKMSRFKEALLDCDLHDIPLKGAEFTYSNRRKGAEETRVRLDRVVINSEWSSDFPNNSLCAGFANTSIIFLLF